LGHEDTFCPTPGSRDEHGNLHFGKNLRAPNEWKKNSHNEGSVSGHSHAPKSKEDTRFSSTAEEKGSEGSSLLKKNNFHKRKKRGTAQEYRKVEKPQLMITSAQEHVADGTLALANVTPGSATETSNKAGEGEFDAKKKKPIPTNSENFAEAVQQPCREQ
jgi:hypothetical protein